MGLPLHPFVPFPNGDSVKNKTRICLALLRQATEVAALFNAESRRFHDASPSFDVAQQYVDTLRRLSVEVIQVADGKGASRPAIAYAITFMLDKSAYCLYASMDKRATPRVEANASPQFNPGTLPRSALFGSPMNSDDIR